MDDIFIEATDRSPEVKFEFDRRHLSLSGESYPEDVFAFFDRILRAAEKYLDGLTGETVTVDIALIYFNSSSAKALMNFLEMLERAAERGNKVKVNWKYREGDDTMKELGEEFGEDLTSVDFTVTPI
jgi:hypothetical protein